MKSSFLTFLILIFLTSTYGQERTITIPEITKENYLKKSKKQKTTAWVFLGTGCLAAVLGAIELNLNYGESTNQAFLLIGGLAMVGASIPLFNASARNKRRGMSMAFKNENTQQFLKASIKNRCIPSLSL